MLKQNELLHYEIYSSPVSALVSWRWAQRLLGKYFAFKIRRKYKRYYDAMKQAKQLQEAGLNADSKSKHLIAIQAYLNETFLGRVPKRRLLVSSANLRWIDRSVQMTDSEKAQIASAIRLCETFKL